MYRRLENISWRLELLGIRHRSESSAMLGRMVGSDDVAPLRVLANAVRPVGIDGRQDTDSKAGTQETALTPMNRLVDAVPPESESARDFVDAVNGLIAGKFADRKAETEIRHQLMLWRDNDAQLEPLIAKSAVLKELAPVSANLSALGAAGVQALDFIDRGEKPPADWTAQTLAMIQKAQDPQADVFIAVTPAIQALVNAAAGTP